MHHRIKNSNLRKTNKRSGNNIISHSTNRELKTTSRSWSDWSITIKSKGQIVRLYMVACGAQNFLED